jgi:hypothetical protein
LFAGRCAFDLFNCSDFVAADFCVFALVINIQQLARLSGVEKQSVGAYELQRVPLRGIVTRRDRDSAVCFAVSHL